VPPAGGLDEPALLQALAGLSPIEYDRGREAAAKTLGIRVQTLDAEVARRRPQPDESEEETPTNDRRGVPRGTLRALDPAPKVDLDGGWSVIVSEACRSNYGLRFVWYGMNGTASLAGELIPASPQSMQDAIALLSRETDLDALTVRQKLVSLALDVEGALRTLEAKRPQVDALAGSAVLFEELTPWPEPVDGAGLLTALAETFTRYVVLPQGGADLLALWVVHTYALDGAQVTPILAILSPQKRCGKTTLLGVLTALVHKPLPGANITPAATFRSIEAFTPTLLVDEADSFIRDNEELRGVLNSGHSRSMAYVLRMVPKGDGFEPRRFSTWCCKAIAGIGRLPETLEDRSVVLTLQRKTREEKVRRWREAIRQDLLPRRQQCLAWAQEHAETLQLATPALPAALNDRAADNWEPLLAIAETAGGEWSERARRAIAQLEGLRPAEDTAAVILLKDMHTLFVERKTDRLLSNELVEALRGMEDRPWPEWSKGKPLTVRQVAKLLAPFEIRPKTIRDGPERGKGYLLHDCAEIFSRYLGSPSVTPCQASNDADLHENPSVTLAGRVTDEKTRNPASDNVCHGGTDEKGVEGRNTMSGAVPEEVF
jgi:putative DNA primase/helicase